MDEVDQGTHPMSGENLPSVGVIILNWNGYEDTNNCLESVEEATYPNFDIVIVDNGSSDGSGRRLQKEHPEKHVIFNEENKGFAGGCNEGLSYLREQGFNYALLLNNDCVVAEDFIEPLVSMAENREKVAGVGGVIRRMDNGDIWSAGGDFDDWLVKLRPVQELRKEPYETECLSGALFLLPLEALEELGGFDERFFFGFEDCDFSRKARANGWHLFVNPESIVYHKVSSSAGKASPFKYYHATRNRLFFAQNHVSLVHRVIFYSFFLLSRLARFIQWAMTGDRVWSRAKAISFGFYDFLKDNPPKKPDSFDIDPKND